MALTITMNNLNFNISSGMNLAYMLTDTPIYPAVGGVYKFRFLIEVNYNIQSNPLITKTISFTQQITDNGKSLFNFSEIYKSIARKSALKVSALSEDHSNKFPKIVIQQS